MSALLLIACSTASWAQTSPAETPPSAAPIFVKLETTLGPIELQLEPQRAPQSVANFVAYVNSGFYDGMIFNRVIPGFMAQGGGYDQQFHQRPMRAPVKNEADNGLKNVRGSVAMARTSLPNSATSEFFINFVDNAVLDYPSPDGWGYTVFGHVTEGLEVLDKMEAIPTGPGGHFPTDVPQTPIVITRATIDHRAVPAAIVR